MTVWCSPYGCGWKGRRKEGDEEREKQKSGETRERRRERERKGEGCEKREPFTVRPLLTKSQIRHHWLLSADTFCP